MLIDSLSWIGVRPRIDLLMTIPPICGNNAGGWRPSLNREPTAACLHLRIAFLPFFSLLVRDVFLRIVLAVRDVNSHLCVLRIDPFEEEAKADVISISCKLPVETAPVQMSWHPHRHSLAMSNLQDCLPLFFPDCFFENVYLLSRPHGCLLWFLPSRHVRSSGLPP